MDLLKQGGWLVRSSAAEALGNIRWKPGKDETGGFFFMFSMDTVVLSGSIIEADEDGNPITITYSCTLIQE